VASVNKKSVAKKQLINILAGSFGYVTFRARSKTIKLLTCLYGYKKSAKFLKIVAAIHLITIGESDQ
jgi:hypothetical protein